MATTKTTKTKKTATPKGEARRGSMGYSRGVPMKDGTILEKGQYPLRLVSMGKEGDKGWKIGKSGWPSRTVEFIAEGTEDEATGNEVKLRMFVSTSPKIFFVAHNLAAAADYAKELDFGDAGDPENPGDPQTRTYRQWIDGLLKYIMDKEIVLQAEVEPEEYQGRQSNRVKKFLPSEEADLSGGGDDDTEEEEENEGGGDEEGGNDEGDEEMELVAASECEAGQTYQLDDEGTTGEFLGVKAKKARFKTEDGSVVSIPEDQEVGVVTEEEEEEEGDEDESADDEGAEPEPEPAPAKKPAGKKPKK